MKTFIEYSQESWNIYRKNWLMILVGFLFFIGITLAYYMSLGFFKLNLSWLVSGLMSLVLGAIILCVVKIYTFYGLEMVRGEKLGIAKLKKTHWAPIWKSIWVNIVYKLILVLIAVILIAIFAGFAGVINLIWHNFSQLYVSDFSYAVSLFMVIILAAISLKLIFLAPVSLDNWRLGFKEIISKTNSLTDGVMKKIVLWALIWIFVFFLSIVPMYGIGLFFSMPGFLIFYLLVYRDLVKGE